jgi:hypothetical protein
LPNANAFDVARAAANIGLIPQHQDFGLQRLSRFAAIVQQADEQEADCNRAAIMFWFVIAVTACQMDRAGERGPVD